MESYAVNAPDGASSEAAHPPPSSSLLALCRQRVEEWYPHLYQRVYFVPPVYMNRTQHREMQVAGQTAIVTQPAVATLSRGQRQVLRESDVRDDLSQQKVLDCLQRAHTEQGQQGMFVLSQLNFGSYLNEPSFAPAAAALPRPLDLKADNKERGDFDVLILHRNHGVLVGEIKSVGDLQDSLSQGDQDQLVARKVKQAVRQLEKADTVLLHLMSDLAAAPRIQTTVMLPNVSRAQLLRVTASDPQLARELGKCLGVTEGTEASILCMTSDDVLSPAHWWQHWLSGRGPDPVMTDDVYLELVARFCGPATRVTVHCASTPRLARAQHSVLRTPAEGVQETAARFAPVDIVLHPSQVSALNQQNPQVYIHGPPGTGKTLVLTLKATEWLKRGRRVQVVSTSKYSRAASEMIFSQLRLSVQPGARGLVKLHVYDLSAEHSTVEEAVETLKAEAVAGRLYLICDEVSGLDQRRVEQQCFTRLCVELQKVCGELHVWSASLYHGLRPGRMREVCLTEPLRTPPSVTRHVQQQPLMGEGREIRAYTPPAACPATEGPHPIVLTHSGRGTHSAGRPRDCVHCGRQVAAVLRDFHLGAATGTTSADRPQPLRYRDVIILTNLRPLDDADSDVTSSSRRKTSGLLRGLREEGVPVKVLKSTDWEGVVNVANMAGPDVVVATDNRVVQGLERKVVVCVGSVSVDDDRMGRLKSASRCTSQLVWIEEARDHTGSSEEDNSD